MLAIVINKEAYNYSNKDIYLDALKNAGIEYQLFIVLAKDVRETIEKVVNDFKIILIGGGDGSIRIAAEMLVFKDNILGILPIGTLNHFAVELNLPQDPEQLVSAIKNHNFNKVDTVKVNDTIFINNLSIGFYPNLARKRELLQKKMPKYLAYLVSFFQMLTFNKNYKIICFLDHHVLNFNTPFMLISNNPYSYNFPFKIERKGNSGKMSLYVLNKSRFWFQNFFLGLLHSKFKEIELSKDTKININILKSSKTRIAIDGDTRYCNNNLIIEQLHKSLNILVS